MLPAGLTPRRVLMTCDALGGVWRYAIDLARALRERDIGAVLVGTGPRPDPARAAECAGIELEWLDHPPAWMAPDRAALIRLGADLSALQRRHGADLVQVNQLAEASALAVEAPVVVAAHSCLATWWDAVRGGPPPGDWAWRCAAERRGLRRADAILAPSASHAAAVRRAYGPDVALHLAPNAAGASPPSEPKEPFVLAAGRWWDEGKNLALIDAAAGLCRWPVRLCGALEGPGGGGAAVVRHARSLGQCDAAATRRLMARAAIFVSPSIYEPFGLAALEAAHAGAALVLADIPTYRENWDGAAVFVGPHDPSALAQALDALAEDAALRARFGAAARRRAARFGPDRQMTAVRAAYAAACASWSAGARAPAIPAPLVAE